MSDAWAMFLLVFDIFARIIGDELSKRGSDGA